MTRPIDEVLAEIERLRSGGAEFCVVTVVRTANATSAKAGAKAVVLPDGSLHGFLGGGCVQGAVRRAAAAALAEGEARLIRVRPRDEVTGPTDADGTELHGSACPSGGTVDLFVEPMRRPPRVVVCGASPVAAALADLAPRLGWRVAVAARDGAGIPAEQHTAGFDLGPFSVASADAVVVATQGKGDGDALAAALASPAAYVAFVGSRRKAAAMKERLRSRNIPEARLSILSAPAGLDIHAIEPAEIALSILAEIVAFRRRHAREAAPLPPTEGQAI